MVSLPTVNQDPNWASQLNTAITSVETIANLGVTNAALAAAAAALRLPLAGGSLTGPLSIKTTGSAEIADLPLGRTGSLNTGLNLIGSAAGGEDEAGGVDFDSTVRVNAYAYQRAESTSYAEQWRTFLMRVNAKGIFAWYKPQSGYDVSGLPTGSNWNPMAWIVAHAASNDDITDFHNHLSFEIPDAAGAVQTRLELPFGPQGVGIDQTIRGVDHTNIKTNLADLTVRAAGSTAYGGGRVGILRVAGGSSVEKILEYGKDADSLNPTATRWRVVCNTDTESGSDAGANLAIRRHTDSGSQGGTALFIRRSDGNIAMGQATAESARMAAIWGTSGHHGFYAKPSSSPGSGAAFAGNLTATTDRLLDNKVTSDASSRIVIFGDGKTEWGDGTTRDTNLYRASADLLTTDDSLSVGAHLDVTARALGLWTPRNHGLIAMSFDPAVVTNGAAVTNGTVYLVGLAVNRSATAVSIKWGLNAAAVTPTAASNWIGLYNSAGTRLATVDITAKTTATGVQTETISQAVTPGLYWVGMVFNAATPPQPYRSGGLDSSLTNVGLTASTARYATNGTGQTTLPSPITPASNTNNHLAWWVGLG